MSLRDTCYWPNGTAVATDSDLAPCPRSSGRANSMCCATVNRAQPDFCQMYSNNDPNGLCMGGSGDSGVWRNACTDRNWGSDCLNLCANGEGAADDQYYGDMAKSSWPITPCGNGMYCCGRGQAATRCCRDKTGYYTVNNTGVKEKPASLQFEGTAAAPTITITSAPTSPAALESGTDGGVIAGSVVGGFAAGAIIAILAFLLYHRNILRKHQAEWRSNATNTADPRFGPVEVPANEKPVELGASIPQKDQYLPHTYK